MFRGGIGAPEILLILVVVVFMFGASKLPDLARGSGRALRIFKAEIDGLDDDKKRSRDSGETVVHEPVVRETDETVRRPDQS